MGNSKGILSPKERDELLIRIDERTLCLPDLRKEVATNSAWRKGITTAFTVVWAVVVAWLARLQGLF